MNGNLYLELFGYLGSVMVVVSMLMTSVVKLRVLNAVGSMISGTYALLIGSFPLMLMNVCLLAINLYNLVRLLRVKNHYELVEARADDGYVAYFLQHYEKDIRSFFPKFEGAGSAALAYITCCNDMPVGLVLGTEAGDALDVVLDYTIPAYRDCSVAAFLYPALAERGYSSLRFARAGAVSHMVYLHKMGFAEQQGALVKKLR